MYSLEAKEHLHKLFKKMSKKNKRRLRIIGKKVEQILKNPYHFKPLKGVMRSMRRVHINSSFVLIYEVEESKKKVILLDYEHHDKVYRARR